MNKSDGLIIVLIAVGAAIWWLQEHIGFEGVIMIGAGIVAILIWSLVHKNNQKTSEHLIQHKMADARVQAEHLRLLREALRNEYKTEQRAAQIAAPLIRHGVAMSRKALQAQMQAKMLSMRQTALTVEEDQEDEYNPYDEDSIEVEYEVDLSDR